MIEEIKIDRLEELIQEMMKKIRDAYPTESAEGNPIEIENAAAAPLVKCVTAISGSQSGSGTPSPTNIRPIVAYTEGEIEVSDGEGNATTHTTTYPASIYRGSEDMVNGIAVREWAVIDLGDITWTKSDNRFYHGFPAGDSERPYASSTIPMDQFLTDAICTQYEATTRAQIENEDYKFSIHNSGAIFLTVTDSRYSSAEDFRTGVTGVKLAYQLETPTTTSVTPSNLPIKTLSGYTHIESTTGEMKIEYIKEGLQAIVDLIPEIKVNSSGDATATLSKLEVDGVVYGLPE